MDNKLDLSQLQVYLDHLRSHGRKESTIRNRSVEIRHCLNLIRSLGRSTRIEDLTVEDIYLLWGMLEVSDSAKKVYLRSLSQITIFYTGRDLEAQADLLYNRTVTQRIFISLDDFSVLYEAAEPDLRVALALGAFMGLRRAEICALRDEDIRGRKVKVKGKGHGEGLVVEMEMPELVRGTIEDFRAYKLTKGKDSGDGFVYQSFDIHKQWSGCSTQSLSRRIKELGDECGIEVTTHSLRRLYATTLANEVGCDMNTLRVLMRHADVSTTLKCYVNPDPRKQIAATADLMRIMTATISN